MSIFEDEYGDGAADEVIEELDNGEAELPSQENLDWVVQRIEQANLFKHLVNSPVFAPGSAGEEILEAVNNKIKNFALNELKALLGGSIEENKPVKVELPFSEDEINALKTLAGKVLEKTGGQAKIPEERVPTINPINVNSTNVATNKIATSGTATPKTVNPIRTQSTNPPSKTAQKKKTNGKPLTEEEAKIQRVLDRNKGKKQPKSPIKPIAQPVNSSWAQNHAIANQGGAKDVLSSIVGLELALPAGANPTSRGDVDSAIVFDPDSQQ